MNDANPKPTDNATVITQDEYKVIEEALLTHPRGKWFLEEYKNRNRPEDTQTLLSAIQRIENTLSEKEKAPQDDLDPIRMSILEMSKAIAKTREEINSIKPNDVEGDHIINATGELSAIVDSTEQATNTILEAAEEIQEAAWILREAGADDGPCDQIDNKTTDIYTACSFQDITGQRTTKVVQALTYIENRVNSMIDIWGLNDTDESLTPKEDSVDSRPDAHLLNGPAKLGEGLEQGNVDTVLAKDGDQSGEFDGSAQGQDLVDNLSFDAIDAPEATDNVDEISFDSIDDISFDNIGEDVAAVDQKVDEPLPEVAPASAFDPVDIAPEPEAMQELSDDQGSSLDQPEPILDLTDVAATSTDSSEELSSNLIDSITDIDPPAETLKTSIVDGPIEPINPAFNGPIKAINPAENSTLDPGAMHIDPASIETGAQMDLGSDANLAADGSKNEDALGDVPIPAQATSAEENATDHGYNDLEVTNRDGVNDAQRTVSAINPIEDFSSETIDTEITTSEIENEVIGMIDPVDPSSAVPAPSQEISSIDSLDTINDLDLDSLTDIQKETLLS